MQQIGIHRVSEWSPRNFRNMDRMGIGLTARIVAVLALLTQPWCGMSAQVDGVSLTVLGNVQDGGYPHIGCQREDCRNLFLRPAGIHQVVSLGIVDARAGRQFLFEATPDAARQALQLAQVHGAHPGMPDGIFLTHAHWGHYSGLGLLGREAMGANGVEVYAMPRLRAFLEENGPWSQLVELENITLTTLAEDQAIRPTGQLTVTPLRVPHRDEFSETVGYKIEGPNRSALFIPDIDKWSKWDRNLQEVVATVDYAFLDGTFHDGQELGHRDMSEVPHPFIAESLALMEAWPDSERDKVFFIHLNHTNPLLQPGSPASLNVEEKGCHVARHGDQFQL